MNRDLKRKAFISIGVHAAVILFLVIRSFISCHRADPRNISPFLDVQMGSGGSAGGGARAAAASATKSSDSFPSIPKSKPKAADAKKQKAAPEPKSKPRPALSESEIRKMLGEGVVSSDTSPRPGPATGPGTATGGVYHPYAWYLNEVRDVMYNAWQQPGALANIRGLIVTAEVRVQRDGLITARKITAPSGNALMDESVQRALEGVSRLPPLPPGFGGFYKDITIDFELTDSALSRGE